MSDMRNRPEQAAALILFAQATNPIPLGVAGFWFDGATVVYVDPAGNQAAIGGSPINYGVVGDIKPVAAAAVAGVLDKAARADHQHAGLPVTYGVVGEVAPVGVAAAGVLDKTARADHAHALTYGVVGEIAPVGTASAGVLNKVARADHAHAATAGAALVYGEVADLAPVGAVASAGVLDKVARADHAHAAVADGALVADVSDATPTAGLSLIRRITIPTGANGNADVVLQRKERLVDAWLVMKGSGTAGAQLVLTNGASAITNTVPLAGKAAKDVVRLSSIDPTLQDMPAAGTLRASWSSTAGSFSGCELYVLTMAVP